MENQEPKTPEMEKYAVVQTEAEKTAQEKTKKAHEALRPQPKKNKKGKKDA